MQANRQSIDCKLSLKRAGIGKMKMNILQNYPRGGVLNNMNANVPHHQMGRLCLGMALQATAKISTALLFLMTSLEDRNYPHDDQQDVMRFFEV